MAKKCSCEYLSKLLRKTTFDDYTAKYTPINYPITQFSCQIIYNQYEPSLWLTEGYRYNEADQCVELMLSLKCAIVRRS